MLEVGTQQRLVRGRKCWRGAPNLLSTLPQNVVNCSMFRDIVPYAIKVSDSPYGRRLLEKLPANAVLVGEARPGDTGATLPRAESRGTLLRLLRLPGSYPCSALLAAERLSIPAKCAHPGGQVSGRCIGGAWSQCVSQRPDGD